MMIKNKLTIKRSLLLIAFVALSISSLAFDYKIGILEKTFEDESFNFFIQKVVDARLNKQKSIGLVVTGFSTDSKTVGNDSLDYQMNTVFGKKPEIFNAATKVIMVINQLNLRYINATTDVSGKEEAIEFSIAIDYYLKEGKTCGLLYQQFFKFKENVKSVNKIAKDINKGFSETIKKALKDFEKQLKTNKAVVRKEFNADSLLQFLSTHPNQVITNQNVKDGLYFSCKDLYLNNPGVIDKYSFTDSTELGQRPLIVSSPGYVMERVYAIVREKRIFIYLGGGNYKEAVLSADGKLFFPDVTSATISTDAKIASMAFRSFGLIGSLISSAIKQSATTTATSDILIDFEIGDLVVAAP